MSSARYAATPVRLAAPDRDRFDVSGVTREGAAWLASAGTYPRSALALWADRPTAPLVLPCGSAFDVVNAPAVFGRRMLDRLWDEGPGSGPVAVHRGRMLLFTAPGTAERLPALLEWEEWGAGQRGKGVPPLLCHGTGDAVTVPPLSPQPGTAAASRWLVAPDARRPWLPGPEVALWAAVRAAAPDRRERLHSGGAPTPETPATEPLTATRITIFPSAEQGANLYDVSRRR
ncbi:bifunctional DNA primase/polymerase [Streptomyces sp. NPDC058045]|uniref:bifunctional DNA primase/polymerase n=1 Tax=Streptomyces sp. NPDC058045 TaxID=3346311 RepID=UPI0036E881DE